MNFPKKIQLKFKRKSDSRMSLLDNFEQIKMYMRAYYVAGTHHIMEKTLEKMYDCMRFNKTAFEMVYNSSVHDEIVDIVMGDWPEYLVASFSPLSESLAKEYVLKGEMSVQLSGNSSDYHHMAFFGETICDDVSMCSGQCSHTIKESFGSWCMCCRLKQQIPARMMKKIRGADRDFLKTFNPAKGGVKIVLKKEDGSCRIRVSMTGSCHNPKLADMLADVSGYTDNLSVQNISVTLMDRHIKYMEEQKKQALESLGLAF